MNELIQRATGWLERIPHSVVALVARIGIGATFWLSGQTKIEGLVLDPVGLNVELGWPARVRRRARAVPHRVRRCR
jgi:putative oxidoreductase